MDSRLERDSFGDIEIEEKYYWGSQTQRTLVNFPSTKNKIPIPIIRSLALIKKAAAKVNLRLEKLSEQKAIAIGHAADEIYSGKLKDHFPLSIWQSGSGTQTHMNINEVIANRASELLGGRKGDRLVHPNDDVNISQSTNDVFSTAMQLATIELLRQELNPTLKLMLDALEEKAIQYKTKYKIGRTHLMDAVPMSVGMEFETWASQLNFHFHNLQQAMVQIAKLPIGGSAIGSGLNSSHEFSEQMVSELSRLMDFNLTLAHNKYALISNHDSLIHISGILRNISTALNKIACDLRLLGSGPRCGLAEILLPENESGSSIMPGKINPTQCEMLSMVCARVIGNDATIAFANASGQLQLNTYKPLMALCLIESIDILSEGCLSFTTMFLKKLRSNDRILEKNLENSLMLVTILSPIIGYDKASKIALKAYHEGKSLKKEILNQNIMSEKELSELMKISNFIPE